MKALLINPESQSVQTVDVTQLAEIKALIGFEPLESDPVGQAGDRIYFDEECFLRGAGGRFQLDNVVPIAGKAVVVGSNADGSLLADVAVSQADLTLRIRYL